MRNNCGRLVQGFIIATCCGQIPSASGQVQAPRRTATLDLEIHGAANHLSGVSSIGVAADGSIAVLQPAQHSIRFFSVRGAPLATIGGAGDLTAHFRSLSRYGWLADTLWVADDASRQTVFIAPGPRVTRSTDWSANLPLIRDLFSPDHGATIHQLEPAPRAIYAGGSHLVAANLPGHPALSSDDRSRGPSAFVRVSGDGQSQRVIATAIRSDQMACSITTPGSNDREAVPYCAHPLAAVAEDGSRIAFIAQANASGKTGAFRLTMLDALGDTVFARSYRYATIPVKRSDVERNMAAVSQMMGGRGSPQGSRTMALDRLPATYPPVRRLLIGRDGSAWIEIRAPVELHRWLIVSPHGVVTGSLDLPVSTSVKSATTNQVLATRADSVEHRQNIVRLMVH